MCKPVAIRGSVDRPVHLLSGSAHGPVSYSNCKRIHEPHWSVYKTAHYACTYTSTTFVGVALRRIPADLHTVNTIGSLRICTVAWPPHIFKLNVRFNFINRTPRIFLMPALRWSDTTLHQLIIIIAPACIHNTWIWWWWNVSVWKTAEVHFCTWLNTWMMQLSVATCMCLRQGPHLLLLHPL